MAELVNVESTTEAEEHHFIGCSHQLDDSQCCTCTMLTFTPQISAWEERKIGNLHHRILNPDLEHKRSAHFRVMESSTLHVQPSLTILKSSSAALSENTDPKSISSPASSSSNIPYYIFSHQKAPSSHARDYRKNYTYPNIERQVMSNHLRRGVGNYSHSSLSSLTPKLIVLGECMADTKQPTSKPPVKVLPIQSARPRLGEARFLLPRRIAKPPQLRHVPSLLVYPNNMWRNIKPVPLHVPIRGSSIELKRPNASDISQSSMGKTEYYCPPATLHFDPGILPYAHINPGKVAGNSSRNQEIRRIDSATVIPHKRSYKQH